MMRNNTFRKNQLSVCYTLSILCYFLIFLFTAVCFAGVEKKNEENNLQPFLFENIGKNVPKELSGQIEIYWKYKGSRKFQDSYEIEAPHSKYQIPLETYNIYHAKARNLKGCRILNIKMHESLAIVTTELLFDNKIKTGRSSAATQTINDHWIELNGKWYHVYVNPFANIR